MGEVWSTIPSALHKSQDWHEVLSFLLPSITLFLADDSISLKPPAQALSSVSLHSKYDYQPATKVSTPQSAPRPKFKPS